LTAKYGATLGLLPPEKKAEYVKDYNALSKAVEEDVKKKTAKEVEKKERKLKAEKEKLAKYNVPWNELSENMNKQRMVTVLNQLITTNGGKMPEFVTERVNDYAFQNKKTGDMFFVAKDGSQIETAQRLIEMPKLKASASAFGATVNTEKEVSLSYNGNEADTDLTDKLNISMNKDFKPNEFYSQGKQTDIMNPNEKLPLWEEGADNIHFKAGAEATADGARTSRIYINEDGSAHKIVIEVKAFDFDAYVKANLKGVGLKAGLDIASGEGQYAYIQSPTLENENGIYHIRQREYAGKLGAALGVAAEANISGNALEVQGKLGVKLGAGYINHDSVKNFKHLPAAVTNRLMFDNNKAPDYLDSMDNFHISPMSAPPTIEDSSLKYFRQAAKDAGIVGIASKK
jgi:hypothetical protein